MALIVELRQTLTETGLDNGAHTIAWHLAEHHQTVVSPATIWRHLNTAGLITPQPKKRPKASYIRFQADQPNEMWQSDFTHRKLSSPTSIAIPASACT